jgi:hypothetical protein
MWRQLLMKTMDYLSEEDLSDYLCISKKEVIKLIGEIPNIKIGKRLFANKTTAMDYLNKTVSKRCQII